MFVVAVGNAFDGITLYGPYPSVDAAQQSDHARGQGWEIIPVYPDEGR